MTPISCNNGALRVALASEHEVSLFRMSVPDGCAKAELDRWILLSLTRVRARKLTLAAVGISSKTTRWWLTSSILRLQEDRLLTASGSLYRLGDRYSRGDERHVEACVQHFLSVAGHQL